MRGPRAVGTSDHQEDFWLLQRMSSDPDAYTVAGHVEVDGPLDPDALGAALAAVVAASPVLRTSLHADGGPTRNLFLMQFTADLTRTEINVAEVAESSAWGAAMNGLLGLGVCRSLAELDRLPRRQRTFRPSLKSGEADRLHSGWRAAVRRVL